MEQGIPLIKFIKRLSPELDEPVHLTDYCDLLQRAAWHPGVRGLCDVPIRH